MTASCRESFVAVAAETASPDVFLRELIAPAGEGALAWVASFPEADAPKWQGRLTQVDRHREFSPDLNHYVSTAAFPRKAGGREVDKMLGCVAIVIDDPTTKGNAAKLFATLGKPTAIVQTSRRSYHWWYFMKAPASAVQARPVLARIKLLGLGDKSGNNAVRYARLPCGVNNKKEHGESFDVRMVEWTGRRFSIEKIARALNAEQAEPNYSRPCPMNSDLSDEELREQVLAGESYHDAVMVLAARMIARGREPQDVIDDLQRLMESCPKDTRRQESWQKSYDDIPTKFVDTAVKKYSPRTMRVMEDFVSFLPSHSYLFLRTMQLWPSGSVDACVRWPGKGKAKIRPSTCLDRDRPAHAMTWCPGEPTLIEGKVAVEGGWEEDPASTTINTYKEPIRQKGDAGRATFWVKHLRLIYPDYWKHIADWLAFKVQNPGVKINHAIVLAGNHGIGKDSLLDAVRYAVGVTNYKFIGPKALVGEFNPFVKSVILHVSEARDLGPNDRFRFYESNKDLIAAPPATIPVNDKHLRTHYVFNVLGVVFTTNYPVDGLFLPADDRRHYVANSAATKEQFEEDYWKRFWARYREGGTWDVVDWLLNRDVSRFDPGAPPPKTEAWKTMVQGSSSGEDLSMHAVIEELGTPKALTIEMLRSKANGELREFLDDRDNRKAFKHRLSSLSYHPFVNDDTKSGLWKIAGDYVQVYVRADVARSEVFAAIREIQVRAKPKRSRTSYGDDEL